MTQADTVDTRVHILIDEWDDGIVDTFAWVKVSELTLSAPEAKARLEREFPADEQGEEAGEGLYYQCVGMEWLAPPGLPDADGKVIDENAKPGQQRVYHWPDVLWRVEEAHHPLSERFWKFELCRG